MGRYAIKTPPQHGSWAEFLDVWRAADEIDVFESAWTMDHFYPLTPPMDGTHLESWTMLAALAQATTRLRLGAMVNGMHFRHPAVTANMAVTLDHISGGRFELGLGAGWFEPEAAAYGIPLGTLKERFDRFDEVVVGARERGGLDEGVEVIASLLTNETTTFSGAYYNLVEARCEPKPVQQPHPPIVIGGKGPKRTLKTVARCADAWDYVMPPSVDAWSAANDVLLVHCAAIGRDASEIRRSIHYPWMPGQDDPAQLADAVQPYFAAGVDLVIFSMRGNYRASELEPMAEALRTI
jgi:F420-dependent oxidoreductase-like protein